MTTKWSERDLLIDAMLLCHHAYQTFRWASHRHPFWLFYWRFKSRAKAIISSLVTGDYYPEPMKAYGYFGTKSPFWSYQDKLIQKLIYQRIKTTFKHIISKRCCHLSGPHQIKAITHDIEHALLNSSYRYMIRIDIKSYYRSINHRLLKKEINNVFNDQRLINLLHRIIDVPIDHGGWLDTPTQGIPTGSSLSGLFAALYLKPLDSLFDQRNDLFYRRYNDDVIKL